MVKTNRQSDVAKLFKKGSIQFKYFNESKQKILQGAFTGTITGKAMTKFNRVAFHVKF